MIRGALQEFVVGDPARLATDVGPVIDKEAYDNLQRHIARLRRAGTPIGEAPLPSPLWGEGEGEGPAWARHLIAPNAFEVASIADLTVEMFGPVLHVVRWSGNIDAVIAQINALGYGLTLGLQTRIDSRALRLASAARIGNVYVNRNMIGAVVGVQPFGGEGLSGTGPKAGGPHYLPRFCAEQTLTINTAAAGGNAALLAGPR
jgi:RHH-type proline utilization regulon transcriptional repressor/proline dehydrogenase/delta 1-pyrroline-5-carboxylate dehydrogenase